MSSYISLLLRISYHIPVNIHLLHAVSTLESNSVSQASLYFLLQYATIFIKVCKSTTQKITTTEVVTAQIWIGTEKSPANFSNSSDFSLLKYVRDIYSVFSQAQTWCRHACAAYTKTRAHGSRLFSDTLQKQTQHRCKTNAVQFCCVSC
jgi:hypothetical protein